MAKKKTSPKKSERKLGGKKQQSTSTCQKMKTNGGGGETPSPPEKIPPGDLPRSCRLLGLALPREPRRALRGGAGARAEEAGRSRGRRGGARQGAGSRHGSPGWLAGWARAGLIRRKAAGAAAQSGPPALGTLPCALGEAEEPRAWPAWRAPTAAAAATSSAERPAGKPTGRRRRRRRRRRTRPLFSSSIPAGEEAPPPPPPRPARSPRALGAQRRRALVVPRCRSCSATSGRSPPSREPAALVSSSSFPAPSSPAPASPTWGLPHGWDLCSHDPQSEVDRESVLLRGLGSWTPQSVDASFSLAHPAFCTTTNPSRENSFLPSSPPPPCVCSLLWGSSPKPECEWLPSFLTHPPLPVLQATCHLLCSVSA